MVAAQPLHQESMRWDEPPIPIDIETCRRIGKALDAEPLDVRDTATFLEALALTLDHMDRAECSVDGCDRKSHAKRRCLMHYERWARAGRPAPKPKPKPPPAPPEPEPPSSIDDDDFWEQVHAYSRFRIERDHL